MSHVPAVAVEFWLAGQLRMRHGDEPRALRATKQEEILALLLLRANTPVRIADLVGSVWPDAASGGEHTLRPYITRIRRQLDGFDCSIKGYARSYMLELDPMRVDVLRFALLLRRSDNAGVGERRRLIEEAMELCPTDALLTDFTGEWVRVARGEHQATWREAAHRRNRLWLDDGEHERLLAVLAREKADKATDQALAGDYLLALYRGGQVAEAQSHYERLVRYLLAHRMPINREFRRLGDAIVREEPWLELTSSRLATGGPDLLPPPTGRIEGRHMYLQVMQGHAQDRDGVRVIGIYGAPGIGKTLLATVFAHRHKTDYPGGVLFARLGFGADPGASDIDTVLELFLRALGVGADGIPADRAARLARYQELVRRRAVLVVLDNVGWSEDAEALLPTGPGSLAIVTSRNRLTTLTSRHSALPVILGPVDDVASKAVLTRLAGSRPDWDASLIAKIATACGGHPLALCLAGARIATRPEESLSDVAQALAEPGRRMSALDEFAEPRQAVADIIGWSYEALPARAARVFRLLGLSPCPTLDVPTAARLTDMSEEDVASVLADLVAAHLVVPIDADRYGMLDLLAEYAAARTADIDGNAIGSAALDRLYGYQRAAARAAAHALWPLEVTPPADGRVMDDPLAARAWLDGQRDDLVSAARHPAAASRPAHAPDLADSLFRYLDHGGFLDQAVALQELAVRATREVGDDGGLARALSRLGAVLVRRGQYDQAQAVLIEARDLTDRAGDVRGQAVALGNLGRVAYRRGAFPEALAHQQAALSLFREIGDRLAQARTHTNVGIVHEACGELGEAIEHLEAARSICAELDARDAAARAAGTIAGVLRKQGRLDDADEQYQQAIDWFQALGDRVGEATTLCRLGLLRSDQGRHAEAIGLLEESLRIFTDGGDEGGSIDTIIDLGSAMRAAGRHAGAIRHHLEALDRAVEVGEQGQVARAHACLALDHASQAEAGTVTDAGDALALARKHLDEALGRHRQLGVEPPEQLTGLAQRLAED